MARETAQEGTWLISHNWNAYTIVDLIWVEAFLNLLARGYQRALRNYEDAWPDDMVQLVQPWGIDFDIRVPVDLVHGSVDQFSPVHHSETNAALIPTSTLYLFPGVSHMLGMDMLPVVTHYFRAERDAYFDEDLPRKAEIERIESEPRPLPAWLKQWMLARLDAVVRDDDVSARLLDLLSLVQPTAAGHDDGETSPPPPARPEPRQKPRRDPLIGQGGGVPDPDAPWDGGEFKFGRVRDQMGELGVWHNDGGGAERGNHEPDRPDTPAALPSGDESDSTTTETDDARTRQETARAEDAGSVTLTEGEARPESGEGASGVAAPDVESDDLDPATNPVLAAALDPTGVPAFDCMEARHFLPVFEFAMKEQLGALDDLVTNPGPRPADTLRRFALSGLLLGAVQQLFQRKRQWTGIPKPHAWSRRSRR